MEETPERRAFKECMPLLERVLNADDMATNLFSKGVITHTDLEEVNAKATRGGKAKALVNAVYANLATNPDNFRTFVGVMKREGAYEKLASRLEGETCSSTW